MNTDCGAPSEDLRYWIQTKEMQIQQRDRPGPSKQNKPDYTKRHYAKTTIISQLSQYKKTNQQPMPVQEEIEDQSHLFYVTARETMIEEEHSSLEVVSDDPLSPP